MPDRVLQAMHRPAPDIYAGDLHEMTADIFAALKRVAGTAHQLACYIGNGHAIWEAALSNICKRGDKVLILATGRFGLGWAETALGLGIEAEIVDFGRSTPEAPDKLTRRLQDDNGEIVAVLMCQVDTATSLRLDPRAIRAAIDAAGHGALLAVDAMASLGCEELRMDDAGIDLLLAGCQKGLMTPPGLGFVFFSPKAEAAQARAEVSPYWDWTPRARPQRYYQHFNGTAPTHHLYGLNEALKMIEEEGLGAVWARHAALSRAIWAAAGAWGQGGRMRLNVSPTAARAHSVTALHLGGQDGERLRAWTDAQTGLILGIGLGVEPESSAFRIGHMGHVNAHMILGTLGCIEAGLQALDIPHGPGALAAAAQVVAQA